MNKPGIKSLEKEHDSHHKRTNILACQQMNIFLFLPKQVTIQYQVLAKILIALPVSTTTTSAATSYFKLFQVLILFFSVRPKFKLLLLDFDYFDIDILVAHHTKFQKQTLFSCYCFGLLLLVLSCCLILSPIAIIVAESLLMLPTLVPTLLCINVLDAKVCPVKFLLIIMNFLALNTDLQLWHEFY